MRCIDVFENILNNLIQASENLGLYEGFYECDIYEDPNNKKLRDLIEHVEALKRKAFFFFQDHSFDSNSDL